MHNRKRIFTKKKIITLVSILTISTISYALAYRYLIERVEAQVTDNNTTTIVSTNSTTTNSSTSNETNTTSSSSTTKESSEAKYDDWSYKSDGIEISIKKNTKGSGADKITYYVADVKVKDSSYLHSAFAKNEYGRNILETTSDIADNNGAILAINGDYYGFRSDGVLIRNGKLYRNEPARTSAALYSNGIMKTFEEKEISSEELLKNGVIDTLSFGPVLIKDGNIVDNSGKIVVDTNFGNRSIEDANPRTGIGMIEPNHFVFIVVDGRSEESRGMTLSEFAETFKELGCTEAYNLDGGGSSTMYFMGRVVNNPLGENKERKISDILYVK
ncbi:hypothetical protein CLHOM_10130 [Clostridium homopropionicum DSM 5847]|uniref:Phosphodiester glycosidase domain-containing protein n=1 Tax=Clostridium homopropionicum DSM 5847 TaxID=1121318 RepID=A0A0L6ZBS3_9CLOT|nr:phosphodiester glycosidase family protein [Clostridium homopropionicum]KOA20425.1 hypothetical protein CLHOM_10130 [Clostridium homopropionicum DSM 5847]SFG34491.1 Exopolysaccharide biosynthesis protein [Clostridium homopropionicum]